MRNSLIKLADNPATPEYFGREGAVNSRTINKGRRVDGPRTKLSNAEERFARIERAVGSLANSVAVIAKHMDMGEEEDPMGAPGGMGGYDEEEDPMAIDDIDGGDEDELHLADDDGYFGSDFDPYGGEEDAGEDPDEYTEQEEPEDVEGVSHEGDVTKARMRKGRISRARLSKDDASSSFGEKDDDVPGNRALDPDNKKRPATDYLIQGGPDEGPGPQVSKAVIAKAVRSELARMGIIRKSVGAGIGSSSKIDKGAEPTMEDLVSQGVRLSFAELNRARIQGGQLSSGIL